MEALKLRPATVTKRLDVLRRLSFHLGDTNLLEATLDDLRAFQHSYSRLSPASVNIYSRHVKALYLWAYDAELTATNIAAKLPVPRVPKGVPHPTSPADLKLILRCAPLHLRTAYVLAAFAGLRCGEITRLRYENLDFDPQAPSAIIDGKGGKERRIPLLPPVADELRYRAKGFIVTQQSGRSWTAPGLSAASSKYLPTLGIDTTLHSMRHFFGTYCVRLTKDPLLARDILGHESVATTQIYTKSDTSNMHARLGDVSQFFDAIYPHVA